MTLLCGPARGGGAHSSTDPADTLNIEFHWLDREPSLAERAMMERAGRSWSTRIQAYTGPHPRSFHGPATLTQPAYLDRGQRVPYVRYIEVDTDVRYDHINGLLILIDDEWSSEVSTGMPHAWHIDPRTGAFQPWLGVVRLASGARNLRTATHEIGHTLGIGTAPGYHALVRAQGPGDDVVFVGTHAVAVHGGHVAIERAHTGPCPSVMSYRPCAGESPSELDFAMLADLGYHILDPQSAAEPERSTPRPIGPPPSDRSCPRACASGPFPRRAPARHRPRPLQRLAHPRELWLKVVSGELRRAACLC